MERKYWLDVFTGNTWEEFLKAGAKVTGFREYRKNMAEKISVDDYFISYISGISRIIAVLEVKSKSYYDSFPIWKDDVFPVRFKVELIYKLEPKTAVPIQNLKDNLTIFKNLKLPIAWTGFFRTPLHQFKQRDGEIIVEAVKKTVANPVPRDFITRKYFKPLYM